VTEVTRCARHGVADLLKINARCIDGQADAAAKRITDALGTRTLGKTLVRRETTTASRQPDAAGHRREARRMFAGGHGVVETPQSLQRGPDG
jgi:hypothetical protein